MAVNETLTMTNFSLPSPKRHRKYEETGSIHDEVKPLQDGYLTYLDCFEISALSRK